MRFTSLRARAATLVVAGVFAGGTAIVVPSAFGQKNNCASIGGDVECEAEKSTISQSGNNTNVGIQVGNVGQSNCQGKVNVCPVVQGDTEQEQEQEAGHYAGGKNGKNGKNGKKGKKKSKKKGKKSKKK